MGQDKWTSDDIGDQSDRVAVVTGANTGLGLETARQLAGHGARVVLAVRNTTKGEAALADIRAGVPDAEMEMVELDLTSLESVRRAAGEIADTHAGIDMLINNAGVMYTPRSTTEDGFEMQFGVNHLGHFAFTGLLLDALLPVEGSRVVSVSSIGHRLRSRIDFDDLASEKGYSRVAAYGRSKLANLLFTYELQRRLESSDSRTSALAAHPGISNTELVRNSPAVMRSLEPVLRPFNQSAVAGALPTLRAATDSAATGGQYYGPSGFMESRGSPVVVQSSADSHDRAIQQRLWDASTELTGVEYPV